MPARRRDIGFTTVFFLAAPFICATWITRGLAFSHGSVADLLSAAIPPVILAIRVGSTLAARSTDTIRFTRVITVLVSNAVRRRVLYVHIRVHLQTEWVIALVQIRYRVAPFAKNAECFAGKLQADSTTYVWRALILAGTAFAVRGNFDK